ncbi:xanthine dehydrogenase family protein subunit M [Bacillus sp. DTU_2020_1000418_1_SI_GHA_SEK_038]|uniref:FAD binding domain-containing protein n=1 Tax=Bacillus sp. DTU_2020_1000418_1_SI_GHA_SEK_038 TaxID=3077585 RepID=UPI0028EEE83F|nr:xanthine dehydrogenase family protein subunit M [Bacillus sp. DTU_2020_1000418_1_SI_GHA_SEK_038]WNS73647.1 xanthine dehydrogenase family protein subunit M [Bacillus sp. DTU_2020_1000418_1_SI_GHA_SEK_038]
MKPATFDYHCPSNLEEAVKLLNEFGSEGKIIAGGQSFIPILNMRMSEPGCLIDINQVTELKGIRIEDGVVKIGALTTQRELEQHEDIRKHIPLLVEAAQYIGHVQTRNRGTVGGSVAHADPSAELPLSFLALDSEIVITSADGSRTTSINDFFITYLTTELMPEEILTEIHVPLSQPAGYAFEEFSRRHGDFALVAAACLLSVDDAGIIDQARIVLGGVDAVPLLAEDAMEYLIGKTLTEDILEKTVEIAVNDADPDADLHASKEYRLQLTKVMTRKALLKAYNRGLGKEG